jgi:hypothetical protein
VVVAVVVVVACGSVKVPEYSLEYSPAPAGTVASAGTAAFCCCRCCFVSSCWYRLVVPAAAAYGMCESQLLLPSATVDAAGTTTPWDSDVHTSNSTVAVFCWSLPMF